MKVEIKKELNYKGEVAFYVYVDHFVKDCFKTVEEAKALFDSITSKPEPEIIATKEV